eukprot:scaffold6251_cov52-Attheya_sp.AAC.9
MMMMMKILKRWWFRPSTKFHLMTRENWRVICCCIQSDVCHASEQRFPTNTKCAGSSLWRVISNGPISGTY